MRVASYLLVAVGCLAAPAQAAPASALNARLADRTPLRLPTGWSVTGFVDDHSARVAAGRSTLLALSSERLRTPSGLIDLALQPARSGWAPRRSAVPVQIARRPAQGVQVAGMEVRLGGRQAGRRVGNAVLYRAAAPHTDWAVTPTPGGIEAVAQVRSARAPERLPLRFTLPRGARIQLTRDGGAEVVGAGGRLASIRAPWAQDARGQAVAVRYALRGTTLQVVVRHHARGLAYPLLVDPVIEGPTVAAPRNPVLDLSGWTSFANPSGRFEFSRAGGLSVMAPKGRAFRLGDVGAWLWRAPGQTTFIPRADFRSLSVNAQSGSPIKPALVTGLGSETDFKVAGFQLLTGALAAQDLSVKVGDHVPRADARAARVAGLGLIAGASKTNPAALEAHFAGAVVYLDDPEAPTLAAPSALPTGWSRGGTATATLTATDPGLGVQAFRVRAGTAATTAPTGCSEAACPATATQTVSSDLDALPDGVSTVTATAVDPFGHESAPRTWTVKLDRTAPRLTVSGALVDALVAPGEHAFDVQAADDHAGVAAVSVDLDGRRVHDAGGRVTISTREAGPHTVTVRAADHAGNSAEHSFRFTVDGTAPAVTISGPPENGWSDGASQPVRLRATDDGGVTRLEALIDGRQLKLETQPCTAGGCALELAAETGALAEGRHLLQAVAVDRFGNTGQATLALNVDTTDPALAVSGMADGDTLSAGEHPLTIAAADHPGSGIARIDVELDSRRVARAEQACADGGCALEHTYTLRTAELTPGEHRLRVEATDHAGRATTRTLAVQVQDDAAESFPVPEAPALDATVATTLDEAAEFLYAGPDAIQTGVAPGTIAPVRTAVIRGEVRTRGGEPLAGAEVSIVDHPEFGVTHTRDDGDVFMAVNGGGPLTIRVAKDGYLPAERRVDVPWQDYAWFDDIALVPLDATVTEVQLGADADAQIARGSTVRDADGERRATLLFPPATEAELVLPDGSTRPLDELEVRATEYTVGGSGADAMPASLPPQSAYTYAAEFSVDEALEAGATEVRFDKPVVNYTENFVGFPVGSIVPTGYYDRDKGAWVGAENGRVIEVLSVHDGAAAIDVDGSGQAADPEALDALGVTAIELGQLAGLYAPGTQLWRVQLPHFTPWDHNWPYGPPKKRKKPKTKEDEQEEDDPCQQAGSIIHCESQVLGEELALAGSDLRLTYQSDRQPGRAKDRTIELELLDGEELENVRALRVVAHVAGREFRDTVPVEPYATFRATWDGKDAFGREVVGKVPVTADVSYVYDAVYYPAATEFEEAFGEFSDGGRFNRFMPTAELPAREQVEVTTEVKTTVGGNPVDKQNLGGWTLDALHSYDPNGRVLYQGDGVRRSAESVVGTGVFKFFAGAEGFDLPANDGGPALEAGFSRPEGLAVAPDGTVYVAETGFSRIRKITPDGIISTFAGGGENQGDNIPATDAMLNWPGAIDLGPDGSLYVLEASTRRVRRITPDGIIRPFAGAEPPPCPVYPQPGWNQYGCGPVIDVFSAQARAAAAAAPDPGPVRGPQPEGGRKEHWVMDMVEALDVTSDGSVYVAEWNVVRRITPDGRVFTVAGGNEYGSDHETGDGGPARDAVVRHIEDIAVTAAGDVYIAESDNHAIRRVRPDGIIEHVASVGRPTSILALADDTLLVGDSGNRVRRISNGVVTTAVGTGPAIYDRVEENVPAPAAHIGEAADLALLPDGRWLIADWSWDRIWAVENVMPGFSAEDIAIPSTDGSELFQFDPSGRHLRTVNALTGATVHSFHYDTHGRLSEVRDGDGNVTRIRRDRNGSPVAVEAPFGQRTEFALDKDGYLSWISDPGGDAVGLEYGPGGLLRSLEDEEGERSTFTYDALGLLTRDENAAGGAKTLTTTDHCGVKRTTVRDAQGRESSYTTERLPGGTQKRTFQDPAGGRSELIQTPDGKRTVTTPSGVTGTPETAPDPRFGLQAPLRASQTLQTPAGRTMRVERASEAALAKPGDPLSLTTLTDTTTINGRTWRSVFDRAASTMRATTPAGRESAVKVDAQDRPLVESEPGLADTERRYDERGLLEEVRQGDRRWGYEWDDTGNLVAIVDPLGGATRFTYDHAGRRVSETAPGDRVTRYAYDRRGNVVSITPPGRDGHGFAYNVIGQLTGATPPAGLSTTYEWRTDGQVDAVVRPDGRTVDYRYDAAGRVTSLVTPEGATSIAYDGPSDRPKALEGPGGERIDLDWDGPLLEGETASGTVSGRSERTYDDDLQVDSVSTSGATVAQTHDADGLLTAAGELTIERDAASGRPTVMRVGTIETAIGTDAFGGLASLRTSAAGSPRLGLTFERDALGRITRRTEAGAGVFDYAYDTAGRLERVERDGTVIERYAYDANGNRTSRTASGTTETATFDAQDRLLTQGAKTLEYTPNGEVAKVTDAGTGKVTGYRYDALGNLQGATVDGTATDYVLDPLGRRIATRVDGRLAQGFLYGGQALRPTAELDSGGDVVARFVYGTRPHVPEYLVKGGTTYRLVTDHLGSVRQVVDAGSGAVVQELEYDAFGVVVRDTAPGFQPFGFGGGLYDRRTGLVHFGAREYDPRLGRWTAKDPIGFQGGDTNLYGYVLGDPVNFFDPTGKYWGEDKVNAVKDGVVTVLQTAQEVNAGFMDELTMGATRELREAIWGEERATFCGTAYTIGRYGSYITVVSPSGAGRVAVKVTTKVATKADDVARAGTKGRRGGVPEPVATPKPGGSGSGTGGGVSPGGKGKKIKPYRQTFLDAHPHLDGKVWVHHAIEQKILKDHPHLFTPEEIHALSNLRGIPNGINGELHLSKIRVIWNAWYKAHPNPTREQLMAKARDIDDQFGHLFDPPIR